VRSRILSNVLNVHGWVTKIYYHELLRASEGTLSCWSGLHLQSLAPTPVSRRIDIRQAVKTIEMLLGMPNRLKICLSKACMYTNTLVFVEVKNTK
jgi:hypothetical protein